MAGAPKVAAINADRADRTGLGDFRRADSLRHLRLLSGVGGLCGSQPATERADLAPDRAGCQHMIERQYLLQDVDGQTIRHQRCKLDFEILQFYADPLRQAAVDRAEGGGVALAPPAGVQPGTVNRQSPERATEDQVMVALASQLRPARGTNAGPSDCLGNLCRDHCALQPTQQ
ncbi:hypothetical protein AWV79_02455 [Cupriavidus sp. UYMMa02A]|nr:hypothetical protein AWV79_02455 [Cupriavidus sp. UYMMa02A]